MNDWYNIKTVITQHVGDLLVNQRRLDFIEVIRIGLDIIYSNWIE